MSARRCPECDSFQPLVPHISDDEIGLVPQYIRSHRKAGREFVGPLCPGSRTRVEVVARPGEAS